MKGFTLDNCKLVCIKELLNSEYCLILFNEHQLNTVCSACSNGY